MNLRNKIAAVVGAGMMVLGGSLGAAAQVQNPSQLPVDVVVGAPSGATVSWSVAQTDDWPNVESSFTQDQTVHGEMNVVIVDNRFNFQGWSLSLRADDFIGQTTQDVIPVGNFTTTPGEVRVVNGQATPLPVANPLVMTETLQPFITASSGSGSGTYSVSVDGGITIPMNTQADTYKSTIYIELGVAPN